MSTLQQELAATLFVELIDGDPTVNDATAEMLAKTAMRYAEIFQNVAAPVVGVERKGIMNNSYEPSVRGCPKCFGSGGKVGSPCKTCKGTGRVPK